MHWTPDLRGLSSVPSPSTTAPWAIPWVRVVLRFLPRMPLTTFRQRLSVTAVQFQELLRHPTPWRLPAVEKRLNSMLGFAVWELAPEFAVEAERMERARAQQQSADKLPWGPDGDPEQHEALEHLREQARARPLRWRA